MCSHNWKGMKIGKNFLMYNIRKDKPISIIKFSDAGIQDVSTSISITVKFEEMTDDDDDNEDESDENLEARDRRYSCLKTLLS